MLTRINKKTKQVLILSLLIETGCLTLIVVYYPNYGFKNSLLIFLGHLISAIMTGAGITLFHKDKKTFGIYTFVIVLTLPLLGLYEVFKILISEKSNDIPGIFFEYENYIHTLENTKNMNKTGDYPDRLKQDMEIVPILESLEESQKCLEKVSLIKSLGKIGDKHSIEILKELKEDRHMDVRYYAGEELARLGECYDLFTIELQNSIKKNPCDFNCYYLLGSTLMEQALSGLLKKELITEHLQKAEIYLKRSLELEPQQVNSNIQLGHLHKYMKNYDTAISYFNKAVTIQDDNIESYFGLIECCWNKKNIELFRHYLKKTESLLEKHKNNDRESIKNLIDNWSDNHV
jgi:tetratricopeptide (TPR) repeat protein